MDSIVLLEQIRTIDRMRLLSCVGKLDDDAMQSNTFEYNTKYHKKHNSIIEPEYSIQVGVVYFADCLKEAKPKYYLNMQKIYLAIQGYNYGKAYISWAVTNFLIAILEPMQKYFQMK